MHNAIAAMFLTSLSCVSSADDTGMFECPESIIIDCQDDTIGTGQMIFRVQVPDYQEDYERVSVKLLRRQGDPLLGESHMSDTECGTLWVVEFRLFNESCENIVSQEIALFPSFNGET